VVGGDDPRARSATLAGGPARWALGAGLLLGLALAQPPALHAQPRGRGPDAGASDADVPDAGARDGGVADAGDAGSADGASADAALLSEEELAERAALESLRALLGGALESSAAPALLGVDPLDPAAVELRLIELRDELGESPSAPEAPLEGAAAIPGAEPSAPAPEDPRRQRLLLTQRFLSQPLHERALALARDPRARAEAARLLETFEAERRAELEAEEAERIRREAEQAAALAQVAAASELSAERARLERVNVEGARIRLGHARAREQEARRASARAQRVRAAWAQIREQEVRGAAADGLYERIELELRAVRGEFDRALEALDQPSELPNYEVALDTHADRFAPHASAREALGAAIEEFVTRRQGRVDQERRARWTLAKELWAQLRDLNELDLELLDRLSPEARSRALGFGAEGRARLEQEAYHLELSTRWYLRHRPALLAELPSWLLDTLAVAPSRWALLRLLLTLIFVSVLLSRRGRLFARIREGSQRAADSYESAQRARRRLDLIEDALPPLAILIGALVAFGSLRELAPCTEIELLRSILLAYLGYRLLLALAHRGVIAALPVASRPRRAGREELSGRILEALRAGARYVLFVVVLRILAEGLLGRGYLYSLVVEFAWLSGLPLAYLLPRRFRVEIRAAYLRRFPDGWLAAPLGRSSDRSWEIFVTIPAFAIVAFDKLLAEFGALAVRLEPIRRALAFLFRRRLERTADAVGHGTTDLGELSAELRKIFLDRRVPSEHAVARYPGLEQSVREAEAWLEGGHSRAVAVVGEQGMGTSAWLHEAAQRLAPGPTLELSLHETLVTEERVCLWFSEALGLDRHATLEPLVAAIEAAPRRVVLLDGCQNMVLRCVGGMRGMETFIRLARRTGHRLFWIGTFSRFAWDHLRFVLQDHDAFQHVHLLEGWTEEEIAALIESRMRIAGLRVSYADLLESTVHPARRAYELRRIRERYLRLLWDYSDGVPQVALHFWLRSLVPDGDRGVRVRLFQAPSADELESLEEQTRFMLHALIAHENLSVEEAQAVLHLPHGECLSLLEMLRARGYVERRRGRYRVDIPYNRAVIRYLRRKHLLYH